MFKVIRRGVLLFAVCVSASFAAFFPMKAQAWGHFIDLPGNDFKDSLLYQAKHEGRLTYCVESTDQARVAAESLKVQTEAALALWMRPVVASGWNPVPAVNVPCQVGLARVMVTFRAVPGVVPNAAFIERGAIQGHEVAVVTIRSDFVAPTETGGVKVIDFVNLNSLGLVDIRMPRAVMWRRLTDLLGRLEAARWGAPDLSAALNIDEFQIRHSTYPKIVHELGHAFGLCDPVPGEIWRCDPEFSTVVHPESVMRDSGRMSLLSDDEEGIVALARRIP